MFWLGPVIIAYLLGSIPFGVLVARLFGVQDIRRAGSGNIGATNVWRCAGPAAGILVLIFDIGKGAAAVVLAAILVPASSATEYIKLASGVAAVIGHIFPLFLAFRGGKGVNTSLGAMVTLLPYETVIALAVFVVTVAATRYISLGSMLAAVALLGTIVIEKVFHLASRPLIYLPVAALLALVIIITHRANIGRLMAGKESKFRWRSQPEVPDRG